LLRRASASANTDWGGALLATAMLAWEPHDPACGAWATEWFAGHCQAAPGLADDAFYASYAGPRATVMRHGPVPFTPYSGHWGIVLPCAALAGRFADRSPTAQATAVAEYLVGTAARSAHGCFYHDERARFLIPDTYFFAAPSLAIAFQLTGRGEFLGEAVSQLLAYARLFQDPATGLAYTWWSPEGMPRSFWSRATAWLAGAFAGTLPLVPPEAPRRAELTEWFRHLARGVQQVQRADGGFHVLLDRPDAPTDCTAPALLAYALRTGVREGLLEGGDDAIARHAWEAAARRVAADGAVSGAYTGWARTALAGQFDAGTFDRPRDFVPALILLAGAALYECRDRGCRQSCEPGGAEGCRREGHRPSR
jgi:hypothetical protein